MFTIVKIVVIVAGLALAVALLLPNFVKTPGGQNPNCINNLRQIKGAKDQWALELHRGTNDMPTWNDLRDYLKPAPMKCPNGGAYTLGRVAELPTCSIAKHANYWKSLYP